MTTLFHTCDEKPGFGRWSWGLLLLLAFGLSGCKDLGTRDEGLRHDELSEPARQVRARENLGTEKPAKTADDPWMSDKAQKISHDLE